MEGKMIMESRQRMPITTEFNSFIFQNSDDEDEVNRNRVNQVRAWLRQTYEMTKDKRLLNSRRIGLYCGLSQWAVEALAVNPRPQVPKFETLLRFSIVFSPIHISVYDMMGLFGFPLLPELEEKFSKAIIRHTSQDRLRFIHYALNAAVQNDTFLHIPSFWLELSCKKLSELSMPSYGITVESIATEIASWYYAWTKDPFLGLPLNNQQILDSLNH
jgi:hypothetical protein